MRRLPLTLGLLLVACLVAAPAARAQAPVGTMNMHIVAPSGTTLAQSSVVITNSAIGYSNSFELGLGIVAAVVPGLPAANGYAVSVTSTSTTSLHCVGSTTGVPIVANGTTITFVSLACGPRPAPVPTLGRHGPLLVVALVLAGLMAVRRRTTTRK